MSYWACARLESRREAVAQHFLRLAGYQVYIPQVREQRLRRSKRVELRLCSRPTASLRSSTGNTTVPVGPSA